MKDSDSAIVSRLNIIINLLLEQNPDGFSTTSKIQRLLALGLSKADVAAVIGKPVNYVTAVTSTKKARSAKGGMRDE